MALSQVPASMQEANAQFTGFKNRIINGAMVIDQRNAGASVTPTNAQYTLDRWLGFVSQASKFTVRQTPSATETGYATRVDAGFQNYLACTSSSAYSILSTDTFGFAQYIEANNVSDLAWGTSSAKTITISFWAYSSLTGTFGGSVANAGVTRSYPFSFTINSANTWEYKTILVAGDTSGVWNTIGTGIGIRIWFNLGSGSTYSGTSGAWASADYRAPTGAVSVVGTNGATFYITGVQLEKGSTATSFDYRPYGTELALCQRYLPSVITSSGGADVYMGQAYSAVYSVISIPFPVTARVPPTGLTTNIAASNWSLLSSAGGGISLTSLTFNRSGQNSIGLTAQVASGLTAGNATWFMCPSGGSLLFTGCEL